MEKKNYSKPIIEDEDFLVEDVIASSGDFGGSNSNDSKVNFGDIWN